MAELTCQERKPGQTLGPASASTAAWATPTGMPDEQELAASLETMTVTPYRDGPYLLRGAFSLRDQDGNEIANARRVVALCRCGKSRTRPFCDGTHKLIGFRAASGAEREADPNERRDSRVG